MITLYETLIEAAKELNHSELVRFLINERREDVDKLFDLAAVKYTELSNSHKPVVMQWLPYYQLCPKCFGEGIVDNPYARGTSSIPTRPCPVCNGAKTFYHALSGSPTVGKAGGDASVSDGK